MEEAKRELSKLRLDLDDEIAHGRQHAEDVRTSLVVPPGGVGEIGLGGS